MDGLSSRRLERQGSLEGAGSLSKVLSMLTQGGRMSLVLKMVLIDRVALLGAVEVKKE
jgi:hypothetical protein